VDLLMLAALAVLGVAGWVAAELVDEVLEGDAQPYDEWVLRALRSPDDITDPIGPAWFEDIWRDITALGGAPVLVLVTAATVGYFVMRRRYRSVALLLVVTLGGLLLSLLLKGLIDRPRPEFASGASHVVTASFPSGHSMLSAVVYLTLAALLARSSPQLRFKIYFVTVGLALTGLIGLSRIYLGVHYPTDVLAGWTMGLIWAVSCWLAAYFLQKTGLIERPQTAD
jgi:undecaprenyl-diphosphatase